ncbi:DUF3373 domain-containing protein [Gammaproteobacteria bacterium]
MRFLKKSIGGMVMTASISAIMIPIPSLSADQTALTRKIESLSRQLEEIKQQMQDLRRQESENTSRVTTVEQKTLNTEQKVRGVEKKTQETAKSSPIEISGDYRFRFDSLKATSAPYIAFPDAMQSMMIGTMPPVQNSRDYKNSSLLTNRLGLNVKVKATEDVTLKARLLMYKIWGHGTTGPVTGDFFGDRFSFFDGHFDGNSGHIPEDDSLRVDQAYATWSGIGGSSLWFSVGRRPSTGGIPTNVRQNIEKGASETAGVPGLLIDYAFDGATLGIAPEISMLPGAYAKFCFGRGFESGMSQNKNLKDVNFAGINITPYVTDNLRVELQWDRAYNIFAYPEYKFGQTSGFGPNQNLGDIDQFGISAIGKLENLGPGDLTLFASGAASKTHPSNGLITMATGTDAQGNPTTMPVAGLMYDYGEAKESKTGTAFYIGGRYDLKSINTKFGLEYNHGSKNWVAFAPASDDMWTAKQGVHGNVYEVYVIHELNSKPISKFGKAQFRLGYQHYDFKYTGSNNWVGSPKNIDDINAQMFTPIKDADDIYLTFDVMF